MIKATSSLKSIRPGVRLHSVRELRLLWIEQAVARQLLLAKFMQSEITPTNQIHTSYQMNKFSTIKAVQTQEISWSIMKIQKRHSFRKRIHLAVRNLSQLKCNLNASQSWETSSKSLTNQAIVQTKTPVSHQSQGLITAKAKYAVQISRKLIEFFELRLPLGFVNRLFSDAVLLVL